LDEDYSVRYTWRAADVDAVVNTQTSTGSPLTLKFRIFAIQASKGDVADWYNDVYDDPSYNPLNALDEPLYDGADVPDNIYSSTLQNTTQHKGKYYPISEGSYTAVCSVVDDNVGDTIDIVANYKIPLSGRTSGSTYFEVAFYVREAIADTEEGDTYVRYANADNPDTAVLLAKARANGLIKKFEKDGVTYYVLRRPKK